MENDILICNCNEIYKSAIVKAIKEKGLKTVEEVGEETRLTTEGTETHASLESFAGHALSMI